LDYVVIVRNNMLFYILLFTFLASIISLFLVATLLLHKTLIQRISFLFVAFAAGSLLATGFLDTLKEAVEIAGSDVFLWTVISFAMFFFIERVFLSLHHHSGDEHLNNGKEDLRLPTPFLLFGDGLHNFIDGMSIAAGFLVNFQLGLVTSLAVFIHEIPHELGDFGILIHKGWSRSGVLWINAATGAVSILGAVVAFYLGKQFDNIVPILLSVTTANFIYLSATDLLPEIHHKAEKSFALKYTAAFFLGIFLVIVLIKIIG
jgi:zinc and cadmium transporter